MKKLRVFISSPGDVQQERLIAKKVIANLNRIYSKYVELETIMWEDLPLEATASFQEGIDYFLEKAPIDIAIFILWSRLGSKLGQSYKKTDGSEYQSGTEYEFDLMCELWEQTKHPKIMVYVKDAEPQFADGIKLADIKEALEQRDRLHHFIEENFRDRETGTNYAYWQFDKQQTFEERLKTHLARIIQEQFDDEVRVREWEGNPYVGLRSYEENEAVIFCGRQSLIYTIAEKWIQQNENCIQKPLLILGESGSGKSSLVKAGLIPYLHNMSTEKQYYKVETMTPSEFRGDVYKGITNKLMNAFPLLRNNPVGVDLIKGIPSNYDFKYLQFALLNVSTNDVTVWFFDQFEELFNDNLINEEEKNRTLQLLHGLCMMPHIWLIISMRNDFYSRFTAYPEFGALKNKAYVVDVPNVSTTDIAEIVELPVEKTDMTWDVNEYGVKLSKILVQEANELKDLPLIEFGLSELYNHRNGDKLTFDAYEAMGKLKGAVVNYANSCYDSLSEQEKKEFENLLSAVIITSSQDENTYVRKTSLIKDVARTATQKNIIKKFTGAHLFVMGKDANGEPTITIVHEMLFSSWGVIKDWIEHQRDFLKKNSNYENLTRVWIEKGCRDADLIQERSQLLEAECFLFRNEDKILNNTRDYLIKSLKRQSGKGLAKYLFFLGAVLISFLSYIIIAALKISGYDISEFMSSEFLSEIVEETLTWDYMLFLFMLLIISTHAVVLRIIKKPKYKTIKASFVVTLICFVICTISVFADVYHLITQPDEYSWYVLLIYVPLLLIGFNVFTDYRRRKLWKQGIFKNHVLADKYYKIREYIIWAFVAMSAFFTLLIYVVAISEKNEKLDEIIEVADELFMDMHNFNGQLPWSYNLYYNQKHLEFLVDNFADEISDSIPDRRKGQVALCLYNLYRPVEAIKYLYPDNYWDHEILLVKTCMRAGLYDIAEYVLEKYIAEEDSKESHKYWNLSYASTHDLIWIAEKLGRFDLAEELYVLLNENHEDFSNNAALLMNYGHIQLMKGNLPEALKYYQYSQNVGITPDWSEKDIQTQHQYIKQYIANDFSLFHWFDVGNKEMINKAANLLHVHYKTAFYTTPADSVQTEKIKAKLVGKWALADSSIVVEFNDITPICLLKVFDKEKNEVDRGLINCRFSEKSGKIYMEELNQDKDMVSSSEILGLSDSEFVVKILDNGFESDKEKIRVYNKISEEE